MCNRNLAKCFLLAGVLNFLIAGMAMAQVDSASPDLPNLIKNMGLAKPQNEKALTITRKILEQIKESNTALTKLLTPPKAGQPVDAKTADKVAVIKKSFAIKLQQDQLDLADVIGEEKARQIIANLQSNIIPPVLLPNQVAKANPAPPAGLDLQVSTAGNANTNPMMGMDMQNMGGMGMMNKNGMDKMGMDNKAQSDMGNMNATMNNMPGMTNSNASMQNMPGMTNSTAGMQNMPGMQPATTGKPQEVPLGTPSTDSSNPGSASGLDLQVSGNTASPGSGMGMDGMMGMDMMKNMGGMMNMMGMGNMSNMNSNQSMSNMPNMNGNQSMSNMPGMNSATDTLNRQLLVQMQSNNAAILQLLANTANQSGNQNVQSQLQPIYQMLANQSALIQMLYLNANNTGNGNTTMSNMSSGSMGGGNSGGSMSGMGMM